jgi:integrase
MTDGEGLYLYLAPSGAKSWRYDYRFLHRRQTLVIGPYPEVSLRTARIRHAAARRQLEAGENPATIKQREKHAKRSASENTLKAVAESWFKELAPHRSKSWNLGVRGWLDNHVYPDLENRPLETIDAADVLALVRRLADEGKARTAENVRWLVSRIYSYAARNLKVKVNPAKELRGAVQVPPPKHHRPLSAKELPEFVKKSDAYKGRPETKLALRLLLLTFVRKAELIGASWEEVDLKEKEWRIAPERMKGREQHIVPLSRQAIACFEQLRRLSHNSKFVFPHFGDPRKHMSAYTFNVAFDSMGYGGSFKPHGVRGTASTLLNERGYRPDVIERQLAHQEPNRVRAAYNSADYLEERAKMMQYWADYLDDLASSKKVVPFGARGKK